MTKKSFVPKQLKAAAAIYEERSKVYGDDYKRRGIIMKGYFPNGIVLKTEDDFSRYSIFNQLVGKIGRYAEQFKNGGHEDSLNDLSVYAQMLQELDLDE